MKRFLARRFRKLKLWQRLVLAVVTPLLTLNLAVAFFGSSWVFPLSPYFLKEKLHALLVYGKHRPTCFLVGHDDIGPLTAAAERKYGLPRGLMHAVVMVESKGRAHRISAAGAMGPAQLMPGTAALLGVRDPFEPDQAIDGGARYLAANLKRLGQIELAVAAYNAGPGAVSGRVPRNGETEWYVRKVMREWGRPP